MPIALLVLFLLLGDHVAWNVLLPGQAWRSWLLVYVLPAWLALRLQHPETGAP